MEQKIKQTGIDIGGNIRRVRKEGDRADRTCPDAPAPGREHDTGNAGKNRKRDTAYHRGATPGHPGLPGDKL